MGYRVQPFKVGPDFIDPQYHKKITGRTSRNLDCWMMGAAGTRATYAKASADADICVTEGVMGLFDGIGKGGIQGSTAEIAKVLGIPVILVVDASHMAGSAAAVIKGFEEMDPEVKIAGVILNRVGSARHAAMLEAAVKRHCKAKVVGVVPREEGLDIPSRHLGLTTDLDGILTPKFIRKLRETIKKHIDMDALLRIASKAPVPVPPKPQGRFKARHPGSPERREARRGNGRGLLLLLPGQPGDAGVAWPGDSPFFAPEGRRPAGRDKRHIFRRRLSGDVRARAWP